MKEEMIKAYQELASKPITVGKHLHFEFYFNERPGRQSYRAHTTNAQGIEYIGEYMLSETYPGIRFHVLDIRKEIVIETYPVDEEMKGRIERKGEYLIMPLEDFHTLTMNNGLSMKMQQQL